jgi:hypothetical protein
LEDGLEFICVWNPTGVDGARLDPVLLRSADRWREQRAKFGGSFVIESPVVENGITWSQHISMDDAGEAQTVWGINVADVDDH